MAEKVNPCRALCGCVVCLCLIFVLFLVIVLVGGFFLLLEDIRPCNAIANREPYIMPMDNITLKQGSFGKIECQIVNYELAEKVYWVGPKFEAEIGPSEPGNSKINEPQDGVFVVNGGWTSKDFLCQALPNIDATVSTDVKTFIMFFRPVTSFHEGWYYCGTYLTVPGAEPKLIEDYVYVSVN